MIGADLVRAIALLSIPAAAFAGRVTLPLLYAVATITGIATMLYHLADHVFVTDLVGRKRLLDANGKREAVDAVAEISGPALGGALVAWLTAPIAIAVDAFTFVASALLLRNIRKRETVAPPPRDDLVRRRRAHRHPRRLARSRAARAVPGDGDADASA